MGSLRIDTNVTLKPEQIATAFWNMDSGDQIKFFAELDRLAGWQLCFQMAHVVREMATLESDDHSHAVNGFRTMLAHAANYANDATEHRASVAKSEIAAMVRDAQRRYA